MGLDTLLRCIIVMVVSWFLAIIFETKQDIDRGLEYETTISDKKYLKVNIRISVIEIAASFVIIFWDNNLGSFLILLIYIVIFYCLVKKANNLGGHTENAFDVVEAFSFMSIIVNSLCGYIAYTIIMGIFIYIAEKLNKEEKRNFHLNCLALIEVGILCFVNHQLDKQIFTIFLIILPHSFIRFLNVFIVCIYEKYLYYNES